MLPSRLVVVPTILGLMVTSGAMSQAEEVAGTPLLRMDFSGEPQGREVWVRGLASAYVPCLDMAMTPAHTAETMRSARSGLQESSTVPV